MKATLQTAPQTPTASAVSPATFQSSAAGLLQRKCACGATAGLTDECEDCRRRELVGGTATVPQFKLTVNQPGDRYEREADCIADQVMRMPAGQVQRQVEPREEEEEELQTKELPGRTPSVNTDTAAAIQAMRGRGEPLEESSRAFFEARLGHDFALVRIHRNPAAAETAHSVHARAFTIGSDIVFGSGEFAPETESGRQLLAHELVHVMQQGEAPPATTIQRKELPPAAAGTPETAESTPPSAEITDSPAAPVSANGTASGGDDGVHSANVAARGASGFAIQPGRFMAGGERLPPPLRSFYESRLGFDLSHVRIHSGEEAEELNAGFNALAFTYGSHIWLADRADLRPSVLLAHELVHVIQQTRAGHGQKPDVDSPVVPTRLHYPALQRTVAVYWVPERFARTRRAGKEIQDEIFADAATSARQEILIPNAARKKKGIGSEAGLFVRSGAADLYLAEGNRPIGVTFEEKPDKIIPHGLNTKYSARRPLVTKNRLEKIDEGPSWIKLGEIKPATSGEIKLGKQQLQAYEKGIWIANKFSNQWANATRVAKWNLQSVGRLTNSEFSPGANHKFNAASPDRSEPLVLATFGEEDKGVEVIINPQPDLGFQVPGGLYVNDYKDGLWAYFSRPADPAALAGAPQLTQQQQAPINLAQQIQNEVVDPITGAPIQPMTFPRRPGPGPNLPSPLVMPRLQRRVREAPRVRDTFNAQAVFDARARLRRQFEQKDETKPFKQLQLLDLAYDAEKNLDDLNLPGKGRMPDKKQKQVSLTSRQGKKTGTEKVPLADLYSWVDLWTSRKINLLARFRQKFGTAFVTVSTKVRALKERIQNTIHEKFEKQVGDRSKGSGFGALALRALGRGLKALARLLVPDTLRLLVEALIDGLKERIKALLPLDVDRLRDAIENGFQDFKALGAKLLKFKEEIQSKVESVIESIKQRLAGLDEVIKLASRVASIVKWAVVAVQCGTPPGWGCLKLVFKRLTAWLAEQALKYCPLQKKVNRLLLSVGFIRDLPRTMAGAMASNLNEQLGQVDPRLNPVFAEIQKTTLPSADEIGCDGEPSPLQLAYIRLEQELEKKHGFLGAASMMDSLLAISRGSGVEEDDVLSAAEVNKLTDLLLEKDISPIDLELLAERLTKRPKDKKEARKATVEELIDGIEAQRDAMMQGDGLGGVGAGGKGSVRAKGRAPKGTKFGQQEGAVQITGGLTAQNKPKDIVTLTLDTHIRGQVIEITGVEAKVTEKLHWDEDEQIVAPDQATQMKLTAVLTKDHFADVSNFDLGTTKVNGNEVRITSYKLPANLEIPLKVPVPPEKAPEAK